MRSYSCFSPVLWLHFSETIQKAHTSHQSKEKKELSKVIGDIFVVSIERFEEKKYLVLKLKQKQNENKTKTARFWGNFPPFNQK